VVLVADGESYLGSDSVLIERPQVVGLVNLGLPDIDGDDVPRQRDLTVWLESASSDIHLDEEPEGRACSVTGPLSPSWGGFLILGVLGGWLRRRNA
jgi:hypothetical protein